jgi:hypothetical protein
MTLFFFPLYIISKTPQLERNWGAGEKREKLKNIETLSFWRESDLVENVLIFTLIKNSKTVSLCRLS